MFGPLGARGREGSSTSRCATGYNRYPTMASEDSLLAKGLDKDPHVGSFSANLRLSV